MEMRDAYDTAVIWCRCFCFVFFPLTSIIVVIIIYMGSHLWALSWYWLFLRSKAYFCFWKHYYKDWSVGGTMDWGKTFQMKGWMKAKIWWLWQVMVVYMLFDVQIKNKLKKLRDMERWREVVHCSLWHDNLSKICCPIWCTILFKSCSACLRLKRRF